MAADVDLLVIGAGIQGATAAHAATRRGLSVLLLDRGDLGGGASSNSMKVAHGGLRYLQSLDLRRSLESVRERRRLLRAAPGLVRPLPVRLDTTGRGPAYRLLLRAGLLANDLLSIHRNVGVPPDRRLPRSASGRWHDALIEDTERLLLAFIHSAASEQPGRLHVRPYTTVSKWIHREGRATAAELSDGSRIGLRAVLHSPGATRPGQRVVLAMNLVVDAPPALAKDEALGFAHPDDGRNLFLVPWRGRTIAGTYNRDYPFDPSAPLRVEPGWVDEVLDWLRPAHPSLAGLSRASVRLVHAGLLPRARAVAPEPADDASIERRPDGGVDVQGVKWTTAYGVSEKAVDLAIRSSGLPASDPVPLSAPLADGLAERDRYVAGSPELAEPLLPGRCDLPRGALLFGVDREWARGLADVLLRRTGLAAAGHPGRATAEAAAAVLQRHLDWSDRERKEQLESFNEDLRFAQNVPDF